MSIFLVIHPFELCYLPQHELTRVETALRSLKIKLSDKRMGI